MLQTLRFRFLLGAVILCISVVQIFRKSFHPAFLEKPAEADVLHPPVIREYQPKYCDNVYQLFCQKRGVSQDPTGFVHPDIDGEMQALKIYKDIIRQHRDWNVEQIDEELVHQIFNPKRREQVLTAARWVKRQIENFISRQPRSVFNAQEKRQILSRIRKTELELPPPISLYADEPDLFTRNEVYYQRTLDGKMRLRVGGAFLLIAKSWFNLVFTLAHEWAHSIDPCEIRSAHLSFPAYDRLTACLLQRGLIISHKTRSECQENDQLSETFADWIAVQITADALASFSTEFQTDQIINAARNSVRDLCEQDEDIEIDTLSYPAPRVRIEGIFGNNPHIRHLLGCTLPKKEPSYCTFESKTTGSL